MLYLLLFLAYSTAYSQTETQNTSFPFWKTRGNSLTTAPTSGIGFAVNNNFLGTTDAIDFVIATNNLERMRFLSSRHMIGIGEQSPQFAVDMVINPDAVYPCTFNGIRINNPGVSNACGNGIFWGFDNGQLTGTSGAFWNFMNTGHLKWGIGNIATGEKMRLTSNGLGINVTSPSTQLHITENTGLRNGMMVSQPTSPNNDGVLFGLDISSIQGRDAIIWNYINSGEMKFGTQSTERMRIDASGNVGIAVTTMSRILHIGGTSNTIRIEGLSSGATFVTAPNASTDRLMYADANGDLKAIPAGSSGSILTLNGSGVPAWASSTSNDWSITGNSSTVDGTNFIGTTDDVPFSIRVNNVKAGRITSGTSAQTHLGYSAGINSTGTGNTAVGTNALGVGGAGTSGSANTAVGNGSLYSATSGYQNVAIGDFSLGSLTSGFLNTAVGAGSMDQITTGGYNSGVGFWAGRANNSGSYNVFHGFAAGYGTASGSRNIYIGSYSGYTTNAQSDIMGIGDSALYLNTASEVFAIGNSAGRNNTGFRNFYIGDHAGYYNTSGTYNMFEGAYAGQYNTTGSGNYAWGRAALQNNQTSSLNHAMGRLAGQSHTTGDANVWIGYQAGQSDTAGSYSTSVGANAGYQNEGAYNSNYGYGSGYFLRSGGNNTHIGAFSGYYNAVGSENTSVGYNALRCAIAGTSNPYGNTAVGFNAMVAITTGTQNVAMGHYAMTQTSTGTTNVAIGGGAMDQNTIGNDNTAVGFWAIRGAIGNSVGYANTGIGREALYNASTGFSNTALGKRAGFTVTTGSRNTLLGDSADVSTAALTKATAIGYNSKVSVSSALVLGGTGNDTVNVGIGMTNPAYPLDITSNTLRAANIVNSNNGSSSFGLYVTANNADGFGYGLYSEAGYIGSYNRAVMNGDGYTTHYGTYSAGWYGTGNNYGLYAYGYGGNTAYGVYGNVGGASTNWAGYFNGAVFGTSYTTSDRKLKQDIQPLSNALDLIAKMKPSTYYFKTEEYPHMNLGEGLQYGLIAEDIKELIPSAVKHAVTQPVYENGDEIHGKKLSETVEFDALNYTEMVPILIAGMQEQQKQIDELKKQNEQLMLMLNKK
jgi:trimeric autotransporter adhesin